MNVASVEVGTDDELVDIYKPRSKKMKKKRKPSKSTSSLVTSESLRLYLSSVLQRLADRISLDTLRPLDVFLGIDRRGGGAAACLVASCGGGAFSAPADLRTRVALNGTYFLANYALAALGVAVVVALLHPGALLVASAACLLWRAHWCLAANRGSAAGTARRSTILTAATLLAMLWKCLLPLVRFVLVSGFVIMLHATLRDPKHIERHEISRHKRSSKTIMDDDDEEEDSVLVERGDFI